MKSKYLVIALLATVTFFGSCSSKTEKSSACDIESFTVDGKTWDISGLNITATYPKGTDVSNLKPNITFSKGAAVDPPSGVAKDFSSAVTYKVTAEDGKAQKTYTARATVLN